MTEAALYRPMTQGDIPLVLAWHGLSHVSAWFGDEDEDDLRADLLDKLASRVFELSLMLWHGAPVGFLQVYKVYALAADIYGLADREGTWATDQFIGVPAALRQGITSRTLKAVISDVLKRTGAERIITDPSPDNRAAIGAYERAGFTRVPGHLTGEGCLLMVAGKAPSLKTPIAMPPGGDDWEDE